MSAVSKAFKPQVNQYDTMPAHARQLEQIMSMMLNDQRMNPQLYQQQPFTPHGGNIWQQLYTGPMSQSFLQPLEMPPSMFENMMSGLLGTQFAQVDPRLRYNDSDYYSGGRDPNAPRRGRGRDEDEEEQEPRQTQPREEDPSEADPGDPTDTGGDSPADQPLIGSGDEEEETQKSSTKEGTMRTNAHGGMPEIFVNGRWRPVKHRVSTDEKGRRYQWGYYYDDNGNRVEVDGTRAYYDTDVKKHGHPKDDNKKKEEPKEEPKQPKDPGDGQLEDDDPNRRRRGPTHGNERSQTRQRTSSNRDSRGNRGTRDPHVQHSRVPNFQAPPEVLAGGAVPVDVAPIVSGSRLVNSMTNPYGGSRFNPRFPF